MNRTKETKLFTYLNLNVLSVVENTEACFFGNYSHVNVSACVVNRVGVDPVIVAKDNWLLEFKIAIIVFDGVELTLFWGQDDQSLSHVNVNFLENEIPIHPI